MSGRIRVTLLLEEVTDDGGVLRAQKFGTIVGKKRETETEYLASIIHNTVMDAYPDFITNRVYR